MDHQPVRVRMAPSPTGKFHLGNARTALINYLMARQSGGQFILRIEDTDTKRFVQGAEEMLMDVMHWLGLDWDEGPDVGGPYAPYHQTKRKEIYLQYAEKLIEQGDAYYCFCTPQRLALLREEQQKRKEPHHYDGHCRDIPLEEARRRIRDGEKPVIRFKSPREGQTTVHDYSRGDITVENRNIDDYILVKSDGLALYHLAAMVDDHIMGITHVVRGADWLATFPLHVLIYRAFGWQEPVWIHCSLFLKPSGKGKMSKRDAAEMAKDGYSIYIDDLKELGYLPEAVVNWMILMGWSLDDHTEFFTMQDLIKNFSIDRLNPAPSAINFSKLDHFNGLHIRNLSKEKLAGLLKPFFEKEGYKVDMERLTQIAPLIQERMITLDDAVRFAGFFFKEEVLPQPEELAGKNMSIDETRQVLEEVIKRLSDLPDLAHEIAEPVMRSFIEESGYSAGQVFGIMRVAITGQTVSPPLFESMVIIGKETVIKRLQKAIEILKDMAG
ncbi:MAG: glutamate--tRNA ligase [Chloroflexi bacterium]|nr:glutamate--tRNA ligase [Chloroflexota bacterium]